MDYGKIKAFCWSKTKTKKKIFQKIILFQYYKKKKKSSSIHLLCCSIWIQWFGMGCFLLALYQNTALTAHESAETLTSKCNHHETESFTSKKNEKPLGSGSEFFPNTTLKKLEVDFNHCHQGAPSLFQTTPKYKENHSDVAYWLSSCVLCVPLSMNFYSYSLGDFCFLHIFFGFSVGVQKAIKIY